MSADHRADDRRIYEQELRQFLPPVVFDAHVHLFDRSCMVAGYEFPPRSYAARFGGVFPVEECMAWARILLPEQQYHLTSFGHPSRDTDLDASAVYTGRVSDNRARFGMALVSPRDSADTVRGRVVDNRLVGCKPYPDFVDGKDVGDVTIDDMLPRELMRVVDEMGLAVTLHIPRAQRLADPVNQAQMVELCRRYPDARIIFAHVGRAYCLGKVVGFLDGIANCPNAWVDTAMVNHEGVLTHLFQRFPRDRVLFGSDAPIAFLRGKSIEANNQYAYLMGEDYEIGTSIHDANHAVAFTTFFYEQLRGIRLAAERVGLSEDEIADIFFRNADRLFTDVATRNYGD